jgi:hypothetical protein
MWELRIEKENLGRPKSRWSDVFKETTVGQFICHAQVRSSKRNNQADSNKKGNICL